MRKLILSAAMMFAVGLFGAAIAEGEGEAALPGSGEDAGGEPYRVLLEVRPSEGGEGDAAFAREQGDHAYRMTTEFFMRRVVETDAFKGTHWGQGHRGAGKTESLLKQYTHVKVIPATSFIEVRVDVPDSAADSRELAGVVVSEYIKEQGERKSAELNNRGAAFTRQKARLDAQLRSKLEEVASRQRELAASTQPTDSGGRAAATMVDDFRQDDIHALRQRIAEARDRIEEIDNNLTQAMVNDISVAEH